MKVLFKLENSLSKPQTSATFLKAKRKKRQFSLPVKIYSAPTYFQEGTYTVSGTLLIDTNMRVLLYVYSFMYNFCNRRLDVS